MSPNHKILSHLDTYEPITGRIASLGKQTQQRLDERGVVKKSGTTIPITAKTSIQIHVPEHLEGDERQAFIEEVVENYKAKMKGRFI